MDFNQGQAHRNGCRIISHSRSLAYFCILYIPLTSNVYLYIIDQVSSALTGYIAASFLFMFTGSEKLLLGNTIYFVYK